MREKKLGLERETTTVGRSSLCFGVLLLVLILSLRKLSGFLLYGFPEENSLCLLSLMIIVVHVVIFLSFKQYDLRILSERIKCTAIQETQRIFLGETIKEKNP